MNSARHLDSADGTHVRFPWQMRWTLIGAARDSSSSEAAAALNQTCQTYWFPLYPFIRSEDNDSHKAKDLSQSFFVNFLETNFLTRTDRQQGRGHRRRNPIPHRCLGRVCGSNAASGDGCKSEIRVTRAENEAPNSKD